MPYLWMLIGSVFFAAMGLFTESLGDEYSFAWIATIRSALATMIAVALAKSSGAKLVYFKPLTLWMRSLAGCTAMLCIFFAMTHYDVAIILAMSSMYPIWVAVLSWPMLGHLPTKDTWLALGISTVGMLLVYLGAASPLDEASHPHYMPLFAIPAAAIAAMFSGVALIGLHRVKEIDPRAVVAHFSAVSTILSLAVWLVMIPGSMLWSRGNPSFDYVPSDLSSPWRLVAVGVTATLGQLFLTRAFAAGTPARVSVVGLSQVAVAALYKGLVEGRIPSLASSLGMLLIVSATLWVLLRKPIQED